MLYGFFTVFIVNENYVLAAKEPVGLVPVKAKATVTSLPAAVQVVMVLMEETLVQTIADKVISAGKEKNSLVPVVK